MATTASQPNGIPPPSTATASQPTQNSTAPSTQQPQTQTTTMTQQPQQQQQQPPPTPTASAAAPRPRDGRLIELLLLSQGVTSYESRVPLLLLDFAYRHSSSILNDAIHLSADPYTSHAGAKPSAAAGAAAQALAGAGADATVSANAVRLAVSARLAYQFRGGAAGTGGLSKEWLLDVARERNRVALPKVAPSEWGARLPSERFVLTGTGWGLSNTLGLPGDEDDEDEEDMDEADEVNMIGGPVGGDDAMEGVETVPADEGGDGVEGGTMEDVFGVDEMDEDLG